MNNDELEEESEFSDEEWDMMSDEEKQEGDEDRLLRDLTSEYNEGDIDQATERMDNLGYSEEDLSS